MGPLVSHQTDHGVATAAHVGGSAAALGLLGVLVIPSAPHPLPRGLRLPGSHPDQLLLLWAPPHSTTPFHGENRGARSIPQPPELRSAPRAVRGAPRPAAGEQPDILPLSLPRQVELGQGWTPHAGPWGREEPEGPEGPEVCLLGSRPAAVIHGEESAGGDTPG